MSKEAQYQIIKITVSDTYIRYLPCWLILGAMWVILASKLCNIVWADPKSTFMYLAPSMFILPLTFQVS